MQMLLERAASFFEAQGYVVKVNPCIIGDSGAIHTPDLQLHKDGAKGKVVFVLEELDGPMPLEGRAAMARDMGYDPFFVIGSPSPEVRAWCERHRRDLATEEDLPAAAPAPPQAVRLPAAPPVPQGSIVEETGAEVLAAPSPPPPRVPERPLTAFAGNGAAPAKAPPAPSRLGRGVVQFPAEVPDDGDAVLVVGPPRAGAPPPRPSRVGRGSVSLPSTTPEDGDAVILPSAPAHTPAPPPAAAPAPAAAEDEAPEDTGAEMLPSHPVASRDADKMMKHDPSIWDPRSRLAQVKQAAKALSFDTTGVTGPSSDWLRGLKK